MSNQFAWYVAFPLSQYREDVGSLARSHGLIVVNAKMQGSKPQHKNAPALTLKSEPATKPIVKPLPVILDQPEITDAKPLNTDTADTVSD